MVHPIILRDYQDKRTINPQFLVQVEIALQLEKLNDRLNVLIKKDIGEWK